MRESRLLNRDSQDMLDVRPSFYLALFVPPDSLGDGVTVHLESAVSFDSVDPVDAAVGFVKTVAFCFMRREICLLLQVSLCRGGRALVATDLTSG